jgi:Tol biopolymer transport system component
MVKSGHRSVSALVRPFFTFTVVGVMALLATGARASPPLLGLELGNLGGTTSVDVVLARERQHIGLLLGPLLLPPLAGDGSLAATRSRAGGTPGQIVFLSDRTPGLGSLGVYVMNGDGSGQHALTHPEPQATEPVWLPGGRQIAFESVASPGDHEVYGGVWLVRADGAHLRWAVRRFSRLSPDPTWTPGGTRMAFVRNNSLYVARPDGSRPHRVFRDSRILAQPTWSPDGRRLAVSNGNFGLGITVLAVGPAHAKVLFRTRGTALAPSWSPDGRKIAFIGETRGYDALFVVNADGTHVRQLAGGTRLAPYITGPSWSPDATRIVVGRVTPFASASAVIVVDVKTARSRTIYRGGFSPQWSPSGRSIAFTADRPAPTGGIYLVRPDGSHLRLLAPIFGYPHFSPDGTRLATVAGGFRGPVVVVDANGSHLRQLTHPFDDTGPVGSPDHEKIAFVRTVTADPPTHESGSRTVYVVNRNGTGLHRIALGDSVAWAPDSARVTFVRDGDIYSAPVAGGAATQLTSGPEDDSAPAWSRDGATIAFTRALAGSARDVCLVDPLRPGAPVCLSAGGGAPAWSPDGSMIAFTTGDRSSYDVRIGVIRTDGSERRLIGQGYAPAWAPDSHRLAFVDLSGVHTPDGGLALVNVDGTGMTELSQPPSLPEAPTWSPDSSRIASASCPPQIYDCEIWSVAADLSSSRKLTSNRVDDVAPVWWP